GVVRLPLARGMRGLSMGWEMTPLRRRLCALLVAGMVITAVITVQLALAHAGEVTYSAGNPPAVRMPEPAVLNLNQPFEAPVMDLNGNTMVGPDGQPRCLVLAPPDP